MLGFSLTVLLLVLIAFNKDKLNLKVVGIAIGLYIASIPTLILTLLALKQLGIQPDKEITITSYVAFLCVVLFVITIFLMKNLLALLLGFHMKIGNQHTPLISKAIANQHKILTLLRYSALLGFIYISYAVWFIGKNS